jgi:hypothetical protein
VQHATPLEEHAPAAGHAGHRLAGLAAAAEPALALDDGARRLAQQRQPTRRGGLDARDLLGIHRRPPVATADALATAAERAVEAGGAQVDDGDGRRHVGSVLQ